MTTQDELIQAELDWTIEELEAKENESDAEETEETADTEVKEKAESDEDGVSESTAETEGKSENTSDTSTKKKDSVMKLLKQRNEARAKLAELEGKVQNSAELESRIKELEESIAAQELEREAQKEKDEFYSKTPNAKWHEEGIEKIRAEKDLSYSEAFQLYAAQNDPTLLLDEQYRNKSQSWATLTGVPKTESKVKEPESISDFNNMSDDDFLAWSDGMAKSERIAKWLLK